MNNKYTKIFNKFSVLVVLAVALTFSLCGPVHSASKPNLGTANSFAVLAGSGITDAVPSVIVGDAGSNPTVSNGIGVGELTGGTNYTAANAAVIAAKVAAGLAYADASTQPQSGVDIATELAAQTLSPGVYHSADGTFAISGAGTLTLNGGGDSNAVFIFKADTTLITGGASSVVLTNGAQARNVFWTVGTSATLLNTTFVGTIMAEASITDSGNSTINGRLLADAENNNTGAVTLNNTHVSVPTTLTLNKTVTNDNGGTALNTEWTLSTIAPSPTIISGATGNVNVTNAAVAPGAYTLSESGGPAGYNASTYSCVKNGGIAVVSNSITLTAGDNAVCTITNDDIAPSLTLNKIVVNDNSGAASESDWTLTANGPTTISGPGAAGSADVVSGASFDQGIYTLSESTGPAGYAHSSWSCTNGITVNGSRKITIGLGQTTVCTITNNDIPPSSAVLYVIKHVITDNGGTADAGDFTMNVIGTNVSDPSFAGAEDPGTAVILDPGAYSVDEDSFSGYTKSLGTDCAGTIAAGEAKTCTITNNDIAGSEDEDTEDEDADTEDADTEDEDVDEDVDIKVTKKADPATLSGPGTVTYTYKVTNEGDVALKDISVKDDKCSPVVYVSGRRNKNGKLDTDETWKYSCTKRVSATETNKATAKGTANGKKVHDHAKATVVVSLVPGFPNAGIGPDME